MSSLNELIEKIEAAGEGSREMDCLIYAATQIPADRAGVIDISVPYVGWHPIDGPYQSAVEAPRYTDSMDAAMTLVEGELLGVAFDVNQHGRWSCEMSTSITDAESKAATPALALCAAALKARAQTHEPEYSGWVEVVDEGESDNG